MTSLEHRIDALLRAERNRDILVHIGPERPKSTPPAMRNLATAQLDDGSEFQLFAGPNVPLVTAKSADGQRHVWIVGSAFHPDAAGDSVARWVLECIDRGESSGFAGVEGVYNALVLDQRACVLHLLTDVLGLRPIYIMRSGSDTWISSRVGTSWDRDAISASINMEAVRSWAYFGYNATDGALLAGWRRPAAATHVRIGAKGISDSVYHAFDFAPRETNARDVYDRMLESLKKSVQLQTQGQAKLKLSLSGDFDSRVLAALAAESLGDRLHTLVVNGSDNYRDRIHGQSTESWVARELCERLGLNLEVVDLDHEPMHGYGEPYLLRQDGFPLTKQIIMLVIGEQDSTPVLNGALGGNLLAGLWDRFGGRTERDLGEEEVVELLLSRHSQLSTHLLTPVLARSLAEWGQEFMVEMTAPYRSERRAFVGAGIWMHDRFYMSNNFLQHMHLCEPVLPYATAELVRLKLAAHDGTLSFEGFRDAIRRHFPAIGDVPHTKDLKQPPKALRLTAPSKRKWAVDALFSLTKSRALEAFDRKTLAPRLAMATLDGRLEYVAHTAMRFLVLETLVDRLGLEIDWSG